MKTLNEIELETVAGGVPFIALPAVIIYLPQMIPSPSEELESAQ